MGRDEAAPEGFVAVCRANELPEGLGKTVTAGGRRVALFRRGEAVYAIDDVCPHLGASLGDGGLMGDQVFCPWHGWRFDVATGCWGRDPNRRLDTFAVEVRGGVVFVSPTPRPDGTVLSGDAPPDGPPSIPGTS